MENLLKELEALREVVKDMQKTQEDMARCFTTKIHQLEVSIETGAMYPLSNAVNDILGVK